MTNHDQPAFYLIDGHAEIFRAYYAIRGGLNSPVTGEPTHAVFGFASMLIKLLGECRPPYIAMAIDLPGETFRDEIYEDYKANREELPEDFTPQEQRILELTRLFGIPILEYTGAEADDVIATVVRSIVLDPSKCNMTIRILSRDKDLEQLISERVTLYDIHKDHTMDAAGLMERRGITPNNVIDLLALTGDKADNVPGVEGIGPKTAAKLLQEFGSIDGIYENIEQIKGKRRQNLEASRELLPLSRELVTLKDDLDLKFDITDATIGPIDLTAIRQLFTELGFRRHLVELDRISLPPSTNITPIEEPFTEGLFAHAGNATSASTKPDELPSTLTHAGDYDYKAITTPRQLTQLAAELSGAKMIAVDTETIGLGPTAPLCGLCFSCWPGQGTYVPIRSPKPVDHLDAQQVFTELRPILEDPNIPKCGHNLKYDWLVLHHAGITLRGIAFDTMVAAFLLGESGRSLDALARELLNHEMISISTLIGPRGKGQQQKTMDQVPLSQITPYAAEDADLSLRLYQYLSPQLNEQGLEDLAQRVEMPLVEVLGTLESNGIKIDPGVLEGQKADLNAKIIALRDQIHDLAGEPFNIDSPKQLRQVLFNRLKMPVIRKTKTGPSTDAQVLEALSELEDTDQPASTVPRLIIEYRQFTKLVNTYLSSLVEAIRPATGRIHASFHQTGAATGRLSSSDPNLQNIPVRTDIGRQIREAFVAEPEHLLISADYSQIELRILAHLSEDSALTKAFKQDVDIHRAVAAQVFDVSSSNVTDNQRAQAKVINFGIIYGVSAYGLARRIEGLDVETAKELITDYRKRFTGIDRFLQKCVQQAMEDGHVTTMLGRRRRIPQIHSSNANTRALGERLAINTVIQGGATADLIKMAMTQLHLRIHKEGLAIKMLLQIHDELIFESPKAEAKPYARIVQQTMESAMKLRVPLKVDVGIGPNWLSAK
ncbi:MAG: DNA polymerase I [Phycisphaeraceae bacterium]|nr:DNA polymerase I [Phycisphaeraceae bacterium]